MKKILGLDLGTNSIGWAIINQETINDKDIVNSIECTGSRIIPMDAATMGNYDKGNPQSQTAERTKFRSTRKLIERSHIRRERLNRVLMTMGWLPEHYSDSLDRYGKLSKGTEPKIAWKKNGNGDYEFIFKDSFNEMLADFKTAHPDMAEKGMKVPYDWTIYYLRKKALTQPVTNQELAWILHSFNQKRGYYQRGEEEEQQPNKKTEYLSLKVKEIRKTGEVKGSDKWFELILENGLVYKRTFKEMPDWTGKTLELIITTDLDKNGNPVIKEDGEPKRSIRAPKEDDWTLVKERTQSDILKSGKTVGCYIYDTLIYKPDIKIRGKLVRTIEREFYRDELEKILTKQKEFNPDLRNKELYNECSGVLYPNNDTHRKEIANRDFTYLFINDIIFYQRPLKSKKSLISDCPYEERIYINKTTREKLSSPIKCIPKSHPAYQEFRLWQFLSYLKIYEKERTEFGKTQTDIDITDILLPDNESYAALFKKLNDEAEIKQEKILKYFPQLKKNIKNFRWNYPEDKTYPGNTTRAEMLKRLKKANLDSDFLTTEQETALWHILYSINDKVELGKALHTFANKHGIEGRPFLKEFVKFPPFKSDYGAYSFKATNKLLSLMRRDCYWNEENIDESTRKRIEKIISGEYDPEINKHVREKAINLNSISDFQGLPTWLACYVIYGRHSGIKDITKWEKPSDIDNYLKHFKQHSLRNPIVEQVVLETLRTVRDIWEQVGRIDEIHIELGREMKNSASERKRISEQISKNEITNLRIKAMLTEFLNPEFEIDNVRPYSPTQQEILKIYEDGVLNSGIELDEEVKKFLKSFDKAENRPTRAEFLKYKLWLDQKYISPYTGQPIPLSKLFTSEYEIEHIIPQSRFFDDSLSNKVICEAKVNSEKGARLGHEFIKGCHEQIIDLGFGKTVKILSIEAYEEHVRKNYGHNKAKQKKLMLDEIPDTFIERQLNDSRYISKLVKTLLSNIVRENDEAEAISKNVITCTGQVTDRLKHDWGVNDVWNGIILPRFQRMEKLPLGKKFTATNTNGKLIPYMPLEYQKGFSSKRIDHRHHAMDAIVIACANRNIVNYLNNESARSDAKISRYDLRNLLCDKKKQDSTGNYAWIIKIPWNTFIPDMRKALEGIIVSFKQNLRVINKSSNHITKYVDGQKKRVPQSKGDNWSIRKSLHKDTVFGLVNLREKKTVSLSEALKKPDRIVDKALKHKIKEFKTAGKTDKDIKNFLKNGPDKVEIYYFSEEKNFGKENSRHYYATRNTILSLGMDKLSCEKAKDTINSITDSGIRKILTNHLEANGNDPSKAFSADGIDEMNKNIILLNGGKNHKPIYSVRKYEEANKFAVGEIGCKSQKFVEADKGGNLYFAVYKKDDNSRSFRTIPLNEVIDRLKNKMSPVPGTDEMGNRLIFWLSPNDLVYLPTADEVENGRVTLPLDKDRIYKMVSSSGTQCCFILHSVAKTIVEKQEFTRHNKSERAITGEMIKETCIPLKTDRLGNIIDFDGRIL